MELIDLEEQYQYREEAMKIHNINKMQDVLKYFVYLCKTNNIEYKIGNDLWQSFIINYRKLSENGFQRDIHLYMKTMGAKEYSFLYEALHDKNNKAEALLVDENMEVINASDYFTNTELESFFKERKLAGECFDRTLELVSMTQDSKAIVSYLPNLFVGGYYHAYVKLSDGTIIDPACDLVLLNEEAKKLLSGEIVFEGNSNEIKNTLGTMKEIDGIDDYNRPTLLKLALFCECNVKEEDVEIKNNYGR